MQRDTEERGPCDRYGVSPRAALMEINGEKDGDTGKPPPVPRHGS